MSAWLTALVLKPFIGLAILLGLVFTARLVAWGLYWLLPDGKLKRRLYETSASDCSPRPPRLLPGRKGVR
jgi:hypothetical protein